MENGKETEANGGENSGGGGMSTLEKVLLASDLAMMGSKVHGWVSGRKNGSAFFCRRGRPKTEGTGASP